MDWESSVLTTKIIGKADHKCKYNWRESFRVVVSDRFFFHLGDKKNDHWLLQMLQK